MTGFREMARGEDEDGRGSGENDSPGPRSRSPPHSGDGDGGARERSPSSNFRDDRENGDRRREQRSSREDGRDRGRERDRDGGRYRDRGYPDERDRHRDHRMDRDRRHRDDRDNRERDYHNRDSRRSREYDRDRERRTSRHRSRSLSRGRSSNRSRSRSASRSPSKSKEARKSGGNKRPSGFDIGAPTITPAPVQPAGIVNSPAAILPPSTQVSTPNSLPPLGSLPSAGMPTMPLFPSPFSFPQFPGLPAMPPQAMTQQATRHARRVYVGGLPPLANEQSVATFFSTAMAAVGGNTAGPGDAVVNVYINQEKKFAFVEFRTVEEASNAMALDGINYEGVSVRVRRPSDYNPSMAATLGPSQPSPLLNLANVGLTPGAQGGADGPDRIFIGGLPYYLTETQIKELLSAFGPLRAFDLVKDRDTGNSKGYGFCVYQDPSVVDVVCAALNGMKMGDKTLTVRRATASGQPKPDQANVLQQAQHQIALQRFAMTTGATGANSVAMGGMPAFLSGMQGLIPGGMVSIPTTMHAMSAAMPAAQVAQPSVPQDVPTRVVCLVQVVSPDELKDDEEYEDIMEDMREECGKYGTLTNLVIPRPKATGEDLPGVGKVFVEYSDTGAAMKAKASLHGRKFGGNTVIATFYPEDKFSRADYAG
ncbi:hypothetical protein CBR_g28575 [Chara braunii]|uniref:RRM domain-containing protein n=1 Tax=Chara braunii TaxID=69332 RepID=A0A388JWC5_CHABU|nr:hypothetical protein CBR_g28575 [Chara braunii]|eukprot:GBG62104.1 hypothetical protein CBR_g28575 [Chara braunii]